MDDSDADAAGASVAVKKILGDAFKPFQETPMECFSSSIRAQTLPSCGMESKVISRYNSTCTEEFTHSGVNMGSPDGRKYLFQEGSNLVLQSTSENKVTLYQDSSGLEICDTGDITDRNLRLGQSTGGVDSSGLFDFKSNDISSSDDTDSAYSSSDNNSQVVHDFGGKITSDCSRCENCGHAVGSRTKSSSMLQSYDAQTQNSRGSIGGGPRPNESVFSGIPVDAGEDVPDLIQPSSLAKRKDLEDERPTKRMKNNVIEPASSGSSLSRVDISGHGNIALVGNDNLTINIIQKGVAEDDSGESQCWNWSGTCQKEIDAENVSSVFRRIADGLAVHVDYRRVARFLEFPGIARLEDCLTTLSKKKCSAADKIFFVLLRWWKSNKFGNNHEDIKTGIGYLLEDLKLRRMKSNLKQYFD